MNPDAASPGAVLLFVYLAGVAVGLYAIDARGPARLGIALLWPLGPLAFLVTITILVLALPIAFPIVGTLILGALAAALAAVVALAQPAALEARFIGNMAFAITDGSTTLFTDFPYESGYSVYMHYDPGDIRSPTPSALAVITHRHRDHWDKALFDRTGWQVVAPEDALAGVPAARIVRALPVTPLRTELSVRDVRIEALPTPHANIGHYSYLVTWKGRRLYFTGDTDDVTQLLEMKSLDVVFVSPWLYQRARKAGRRIDARRTVIYHHTADETVSDCAGACVVPRQGETLRF